MEAATELKALERPRATEILRNDYLRRFQRGHAQAVVVLSAAGLLLAAGLSIWGPPITAIDAGIFLGMFIATGIGVSVGFHRHFTHRSFKAVKPVRVALAILGSMAMQGTAIFWVSQHRRHHAHSDASGDPHSPYVNEQGVPHKGFWRGLWHAYMGWTFDHEIPNATYYAPDLIRDKAISRVNQLYFLWVGLGLLIPAALGGALHQSWIGALSGLAWGGFVRIYAWHNMIWSITSITHVFGRRDFQSDDRSTNNLWLAIPTLGEAWHNNHHAFSNAAVLRFKWWQIDIGGGVITLLERLGLAWDVVRPTPEMIEKKRIA
jgi:stearoyl-CoA desaturase (delta-9 desaturase)